MFKWFKKIWPISLYHEYCSLKKEIVMNKFKLNENVRVISKWSTFYNNVGKIIEKNDNYPFRYVLVFPHLYGEYGFTISELEKI